MPTPRAILNAFALLFALAAATPAQVVDPLWEGPTRLSTYEGTILDRAIAVDSRGRSHAFWVEDRLFENQYRLYYSRFGGQTWTDAVIVEQIDDAHAGAIARLDVQIDSKGVIQLVYGGSAEPVYHRRVEVDRALSPSAWSGWIDIPIAAFRLKLLVDVQGAMVLLYCPTPSTEPDAERGIFVVRSTDNGDTWSDPVQVDPGLPAGWNVQDIEADYDGSGALHAVWTYVTPAGYQVREIKAARSLDGGKTWSAPQVLEGLTGADPNFDPDYIRLAIPEVRARGQIVHVIYHGGKTLGVGRRHVLSTDRGVTWSKPVSIWGELHGAAGTDAALFDSEGRLHLLAQVRFPQGIYHAIYDKDKWSEPTLVYLITRGEGDPIADRVHAQWFEATMSKEDKIVLLVETCAAGCQDDSTWPKNPITFALHTIAPLGKLPWFTSVSSATFAGGRPVAAASIAAGFSAGLGSGVTVTPVGTPLPTNLDGVRIDVIDALNDRRPAGLQFISPQQINYVVPKESFAGLARVRVYRNEELVSNGTVMLNRIAPSLFSANGQGTGVAAATWLFVAKDGTRTSGLIFDPNTKRAIPLAFDPAKGDMYLSLYGTGIRGFRGNARAEIGDLFTPILSIGAQVEYDGLDQINIGPLPRQLSVGAEWDIELTVDGVLANRVTLRTQDRP